MEYFGVLNNSNYMLEDVYNRHFITSLYHDKLLET